jgi:hypothetical protein
MDGINMLRDVVVVCPKGHGREHLSYVFRAVCCAVCDLSYEYPAPRMPGAVPTGSYMAGGEKTSWKPGTQRLE